MAGPETAKALYAFRLPAWAKAALLLSVVLLASIGYFSGLRTPKLEVVPTTAVEVDSPEDIAKRPQLDDFILTDAEGKQKKLSDYRGNVVILSFWASWCAPCLVELPTFAEIERKLGERGVKVLTINVDEDAEGIAMAKDILGKEKFPFSNFFDSHKQLSQKFDVEMLPSNFVIDKGGRIAFSGFGANDWANAQTTEFLESLLAEQAVIGATTN